MERIASKTVTDALASAMENADRMKHVLIIYETVETEKCSYGFLMDDDAELKTANYMADVFKSYVLGSFSTDD